MKIGGFSVILTSYEVSNRAVPDEHVLYKVTQCKKTHNGENIYIDFLNTKNDYVAKIYKDTIVNINDDDKLLEYIKDNIKKYDIYNINNIFYNNIKSDYKLEYICKNILLGLLQTGFNKHNLGKNKLIKGVYRV